MKPACVNNGLNTKPNSMIDKLQALIKPNANTQSAARLPKNIKKPL